MAGRLTTFLGDMMQRRMVARWRRDAQLAERADPPALRAIRASGRQLRAEIDVALATAERRLAYPTGEAARILRRAGTDWVWRPELWSGAVRPSGQAPVPRHATLSRHGKFYHDCSLAEIAVRQVRNGASDALAPFGYAVEVFDFAGSFMSLVLDLPDEGLKGLSTRHVLRVETRLETERPITVYARLNLRYGPNTEQIARALDQAATPAEVEFDLGHADFPSEQLDRAWIDLFFEKPAMNRIILRDLTVMRMVRAEY
ncbi:DUF6478 family protein [Albidovulum sediminicola]|uniref:DUF6478 family protein n=1 Tax=Albidovulum sediminicola TaxID=2984331 RepID=A0ABT2YZ29_9RHOB|nr:DUF6478 family protein [Defluviimonas sp. WL0075]MCV2864108.1 DUF6478 family protein [Defluviimonas sp. WL0075]